MLFNAKIVLARKKKKKGIQNEKLSRSGVWIWNHIFINVC